MRRASRDGQEETLQGLMPVKPLLVRDMSHSQWGRAYVHSMHARPPGRSATWSCTSTVLGWSARNVCVACTGVVVARLLPR